MRTTIFQIARRLFQSIPPWLLRWRPFTIFEIRLPGDDEPLDDESSIRVDWVTRKQLPQLKQLSPPRLLDGWSPQSRAMAAWQGDDPIGITWLATGQFQESDLGVTFELDDDEVWLFASHVLTDHQRQGVYSRLLAFAVRELTAEGKHRVLLGTTRGNLPSRNAHEKMGAVAVGSMLAARVFAVFSIARSGGQVQRESKGRFRVT